MPAITLDNRYSPQPKQQAFHNNLARNRLMVGGAGSGKSIALLWEAVKWCYAYPGVQVLLLRRNFPELQKGLIADLHAQVPRDLFRWNDTKHIATFPIPGANAPSLIHFGHLEGNSESSLAQYLSSAFPLIGIDEVGQFSYKQWEFLSTRNRLNPGLSAVEVNGQPPIRPGMMGATNPIGRGWGWLKSLFVDHKAPSEAGAGAPYNPADYWYIHSTVLDNPAMLDRDPSYLVHLQSLSPPVREKLLYGNLDSVSGQYFTVFDPNRHVVAAEALEWQKWERVWIGLDWGLGHHTSVLWFTRALHRELKKSVTVCFRERQFKETSMEDAASLIRSAMATGPYGTYAAERKMLTSIFASHELFARRSDPQKSQTLSAEFSRALGRHDLPGLLKASGSASRPERVRGAVMIYEDFANNDFFILDTCSQLANALPLLTRDEDDIEDVLKTDTLADDIFDSLKHGILSVSLPRSKPIEEVVAAQASEISDPLSRWLFLTKAKSTRGPIQRSGPLWEARLRRP